MDALASGHGRVNSCHLGSWHDHNDTGRSILWLGIESCAGGPSAYSCRVALELLGAVRLAAYLRWGLLRVYSSLETIPTGAFHTESVERTQTESFDRGLVIFQFLATASLLTIILFINLQVNYLRDLPKGFDDRQVMVIDNLGENFDGSFDQLQAELAGVPGIEQVAGTQAAPGRGASGQLAYRNALPENKVSTAHIRTTEGMLRH